MKKRRAWARFLVAGMLAAYLILTGYLFYAQGNETVSSRQAWKSAKERVEGTDNEENGAQKSKSIMHQETGQTETATKKIALTFDDGPHPIYTPMLLEGLKKRNVKVTFFLMGTAAEQYPDIVKQIADEGHLIGNHTFHHVSLENAGEGTIEREVLSANELIEEISGEYPQFIRPPFGQCDKQIESQTGMLCVLWDIDPLDWCTPDASKVVQRVLKNAREDGIILMHDQYKTSVMAAFTIIDELQKQGYEFVTAEEILLD